jgi:hypothetical protein
VARRWEHDPKVETTIFQSGQGFNLARTAALFGKNRRFVMSTKRPTELAREGQGDIALITHKLPSVKQ